MHPMMGSVAGMAGMSTCVWLMKDIWRILYVECLAKVHMTSMANFMEVNAKAMPKMANLETELEELSETAIEVVGPFLQ